MFIYLLPRSAICRHSRYFEIGQMPFLDVIGNFVSLPRETAFKYKIPGAKTTLEVCLHVGCMYVSATNTTRLLQRTTPAKANLNVIQGDSAFCYRLMLPRGSA
jgi:hypothetical protein